jgi:hypothetical protein
MIFTETRVRATLHSLAILDGPHDGQVGSAPSGCWEVFLSHPGERLRAALLPAGGPRSEQESTLRSVRSGHGR